jgi:Fe-S cluster biogenesis protein NfuA/nitrite reductase/ring-hydroxylating ferredoxin subunit
MPESDPRALVSEVEQQLEQIELLADPVGRESATAAIQALLDLYGAGLERIVEVIAAHDDGQLAAALAADELVAHLLMLHGLHPVPLEERVRGGLAEVRPYLESHGGNVELIAIDGPVVRLRMQGSCNGCPSSAMTLKLAIENALQKAAPEIEEVVSVQDDGPATPLLQIELAPAMSADGWTMAGGLSDLNGGGTTVKRVAGQEILFIALGGQLYAYRPGCPGCEQPLDAARLTGPELSCPGCGHRYDVLRAGRSLDEPQLHLDPVPLLVGDDGLVRIALPVAA